MEGTQEEKSSENNVAEPSNSASKITSPLKQIRTFQGDVAMALARQRESLVSIQQQAAARREEAEASSLNVSTKKRGKFLLFAGSILFLALGGFGAWLAYNEYLRKTAPPVIVTPASEFLPSNSSVELDLTGDARESALVEIGQALSGGTPGELKHLVLRRGQGPIAPELSAEEFLRALGTRAPGSLARALDPAFMLGSIGTSPFIIFKLDSFENAFAGMLAWEKDMAEDLGPLMSSPEILKNIGPESVFRDVISKNKDVRILSVPIAPQSATATPVILYSFFDNRMLIITNSLAALDTLIDRLTAELLVH